MISKRTPPPRPPLPSRATTKKSELPKTGQQEDPNAAKKLDFFSIRYSRDDANESDEEISIVRKEDNLKSEEDDLENGSVLTIGEQPKEATNTSTSSILSSLAIPFLSRSPSKGSIESLSSSSEDRARSQNSDETSSSKSDNEKTAEAETKTTTTNVDHGPLLTDDQISSYFSTSPPKGKGERLTNAVVSSAISLSSLLKKEVGIRGEKNETPAFTSVGKEGVLSAAVKHTSLLFNVPLGMTESSDFETTVIKKETFHTNVPIYNILIFSALVFLYNMLPTTSFLNGFVSGSLVTFFLACALMWLLTPELNEEEQYKKDVLEHNLEMEGLVSKKTRKSLEPFQLSKPHDLESWFFKVSAYNHSEPMDFNDPEQVVPVFATLSGHTLTFNIPRKEDRSKIKRSNMLEPNDNIKFMSSKEYDLKYGGEIDLVPETLTLKRIWAKKYPIYLKIFESPQLTEDGETARESFEIPTATEEMYLFSPTGRGKEEWYYGMEKLLKPRMHKQYDIESIFNPCTSFPHYMAQLIGAEGEASSVSQLKWVNALLGRLFWDVWQSDYWGSKVKNRIQNKISRMKLPPFIRYLKVTDMHLGNALPTIQRAHNLFQDNRGIWVDLEVDYQGGIQLTIETMINLEYYLKQLTDQGKGDAEEVVLRFSRDDSGEYSDASTGESDTEDADGDWRECHGNIMIPDSFSGSGSGDNSGSDTEVESGSSTSPTEPVAEQDNQGWSEKVKNPKGKKILNMLEKVAKSKWVQKAAETKVVQRAVEKFSNLPIVLSVEVVRLRGTLAANIPPPPSNRLWLGFHSNPLLSLIARPKLGERHVRLTHVTDWIQYKLKQEFKSMFVLPNMEDLTIHIMDSGLEDKFPMA